MVRAVDGATPCRARLPSASLFLRMARCSRRPGRGYFAVHDVSTGERIKRAGARPPHAVDISHDGLSVAARVRGKVCLWDMRSGRKRWQVDTLSSGSLRFAGAGRLLVHGQGAHVIDAETAQTLYRRDATDPIDAFSPSGRHILFRGSAPRVAHVAGGDRPLDGSPARPGRATFVGDEGLAMAYGSTIRLWDLRDGSEQAELSADGEVLALAAAADGTALAAAGEQSVRWWRLPARTLIAEISVTDVESLVVAQDGARLAARVGGNVQVWASDGGARVARYPWSGGLRHVGRGIVIGTGLSLGDDKAFAARLGMNGCESWAVKTPQRAVDSNAPQDFFHQTNLGDARFGWRLAWDRWNVPRLWPRIVARSLRPTAVIAELDALPR